ncbi:MAG: hypothetical protein ACE147_00680 [Candidatus Methylomirabilales bacterium]
MAYTVADITGSASTLAHETVGRPLGVLSDGSLVAVGRKTDYSIVVFRSTDGGESWAEALTVCNDGNVAFEATVWGDEVAVSTGAWALNTAVKFYRAAFSGGSFSLEVNGATLASGDAAYKYSRRRFIKDPNGRWWCAALRDDGGTGKAIVTKYSTDGGSSWAATWTVHYNANTPLGPVLLSGTTNLFLMFNDSNGVRSMHRPHANAPDQGWTASTQRRATAARSYNHQAAPLHGDTSTWLFVGAEYGNGDLYAIKMVDGVNPTFTDHGKYTDVSPETCDWQCVMGLADGWIMPYLRTGSLGTLRWKTCDLSGNYSGESTYALATAAPNQYSLQVAHSGPGTIANENLFAAWDHATATCSSLVSLPAPAIEVARLFRVPVEVGVHVARLFRVPVEQWQPYVARRFRVPVEARKRVGLRFCVPVETRITQPVTHLFRVPVAIAQNAGRRFRVPVEIAGTARLQRQCWIPVEHRATRRRGVLVPIEWEMGRIRRYAMVPIEAGGGLGRPIRIPVEAAGTLRPGHAFRVPLEMGRRVQRAFRLPVEMAGEDSTAFLDTFVVRATVRESFLDEWLVLPGLVEDFLDEWVVRSVMGGDFVDTWDVVPAGILTDFADDIQLPVGTVEGD